MDILGCRPLLFRAIVLIPHRQLGYLVVAVSISFFYVNSINVTLGTDGDSYGIYETREDRVWWYQGENA